MNQKKMENPQIKKIQGKLASKLLRFLSYKPRTEEETKKAAKKYLAKYSLSDRDEKNLISTVLKPLKNAGYLDDEDYAYTYIMEQQRRPSPRGPYYIFQFLRKKGLSRDIIQKSLDKHFTPGKEKECINILIEKSHYESSAKLKAYLLRRGFSKHLVYSLVDSNGKNT